MATWTTDEDGAGFKLINTGNVGLGPITSPDERLHVDGRIHLKHISGTGAGMWLDSAVSTNVAFFGMDGVSTSFRVYSASLVTNIINCDLVSGNLGVGKYPSNKLDVEGDIGLGVTARRSTITIPTDGAANSGAFIISTTNAGVLSEKFRISANGNVGIGVSNPSNKLQIAGSVFVDSGNITAFQASGNCNISASGSSGEAAYLGAGGGIAYIGTFVNFPLVCFVNSSEKIRILQNGNVGIGVSNPGYKLDVSGDCNITGNYKVNGVNISTGTGSQTPWLSDIAGNGFGLSNASYIIAANVYSNSSVEVTTASGVPATFQFKNTGGNPRWLFGKYDVETGSGNGGSNFNINGYADGGTLLGTWLVITRSNGFIGINKNSPGYRLDVVGDCNITGNYKVNGVNLSTGGAVSSVFTRVGAVVATTGDYTAAQVTNAVSTISSYSNPVWITDFAYSKLIGVPSTFAPSAHNHAASEVTSGVFVTARLGSGVADTTKYLRGDGTWQVLVTGGSQTPWTSDIQAGGFRLLNTRNVGIGNDGTPPWTGYSVDVYRHLIVGGLGQGVVTIASSSPAVADLYFTFANYGLVEADKNFAGISGALVGSTKANGYMAFWVGNYNEKMVIKTGGVGFNNPNPAYAVDVNGDINFTGKLYLNGVEVNLAQTDLTPVLNRLPVALVGGKMDSVISSGVTVSGDFSPEMKAAIRKEINDELDEAGSELTVIPTTAGSLRTKINYIFQYFRNKRTVSGNTETLFKEDAATILGTATISDNGVSVTINEKL